MHYRNTRQLAQFDMFLKFPGNMAPFYVLRVCSPNSGHIDKMIVEMQYRNRFNVLNGQENRLKFHASPNLKSWIRPSNLSTQN